MTSTRVLTALLVAAVAAVPAAPASAQSGGGAGPGDVELLGQRYGTRPPAAYYDRLAADPDAFTFGRAWKNRNPSLRRVVDGGPGILPQYEVVSPSGRRAGDFQTMSSLGPRGEVTGTIRVPLVLGLFADSPTLPPFTREEVQQEFFDGPNGYYQTITEFYDEISGGRIDLRGETTAWHRSSLTQDAVAGGASGLGGSSQVGGFIMDVLNQVEGVDWGRYDNDGPDGIPNSGDDDGFVDVLTIMHPTFGAECIGERGSDYVWSHKWSLEDAVQHPFVTDSDRMGPGGVPSGKIQISDYTIQPVYACPPSGSETPVEINEIGVLAHELGHGFGLPDLYATLSGGHRGIGRWGLMGSGSWGCSPTGGPHRPCHMSAWSKETLGWADVVTLAPGVDVDGMVFEPVVSSGKIYRVDATDGSGEYLLLENRQRLQFDLDLLEEGLLVWHVDPDLVAELWPSNSVNNQGDHMGVHLLQADGRNDLGSRTSAGGNAGDTGDPFPGSTNTREFHAGTTPGAWSWDGDPFGLTLTDLALSGTDVTARVVVGLADVSLVAEGAGGAAAFTVDGASVTSSSFSAAPFQEVEIEAGGGGEISDGVRTGFSGWTDDAALDRIRTFEVPIGGAVLTATYGGTEVRARLSVEGEAFGVPPGDVVMTPSALDEDGDFWFPVGTDVAFQAHPAGGYLFERWTGGPAGTTNPVTVSMDDPVEVGAVFQLAYGFDGATHALSAATEQEIQLVAENATGEVEWTLLSGAVPEGLEFHEEGRITGVALETGTFTLALRALDPSGLQAEGDLRLEVSDPALGIDALAAPFISTPGSLTSLELDYLDAVGNQNGFYDLGDFRAWILAHPDAPATAEQRALVRTLVPTVRFHPGGGP